MIAATVARNGASWPSTYLENPQEMPAATEIWTIMNSHARHRPTRRTCEAQPAFAVRSDASKARREARTMLRPVDCQRGLRSGVLTVPSCPFIEFVRTPADGRAPRWSMLNDAEG